MRLDYYDICSPVDNLKALVRWNKGDKITLEQFLLTVFKPILDQGTFSKYKKGLDWYNVDSIAKVLKGLSPISQEVKGSLLKKMANISSIYIFNILLPWDYFCH